MSIKNMEMQIDDLKEQILESEEENAGLKEQIEKMKCCENCKHIGRKFIAVACLLKNTTEMPDVCCDKWGMK